MAGVDRSSVSAQIKEASHDLGFDLVGIAPAVSPAGFSDLLDWLRRGFAGEMHYLEQRRDAYRHPDSVLDAVQSVVMLGMNYRTAEPLRLEANQGRVARYAWGSADYHDVIRERLKELAATVRRLLPEGRTRGVVDTAPLLERDFARLAGLGWFGKNTMLINKRLGSWLFLAALLVDAELEYDAPHETSHCGTCTRCLDVCPTDAFPEPYVLDARRCISYLTIEQHREPTPLELRKPSGAWVFGCDLCQDVCPWNRKAPRSDEPAFQPRSDLSPLDAAELLQLDDDDFQERFRETPLWRPRRAALLRNAAIVLGNVGDAAGIPALVAALGDNEPLVRGAAAWALGQFSDARAQRALQSRRSVEDNAGVAAEIEAALKQVAAVP